MFLEPESGLGWYDPEAKTLELVLGMQSPYEAAEAIAYMLGDTRAPFKPAHIKTLFAYMGGGFGGRDHSIMPLYIALAGMFFPDRPVRLAINRYEQFQSGIKRHAFKMRTRIGIDRATGKISGFAADHVLDGGGLANYSNTVSSVSAILAIGIYDIPKVDIATTALHSRGVTAGSMRGYGTLQTMTALEVLIDEAAAALPLDPIEFRRRNALNSGGRIVTGNTFSVSVRTPELLRQGREAPDLATTRRGKSAWAAGRDRRRHRRRLRHQELRRRRGLRAEHGGNRCAGPDRHPWRSCRYGQRHRHGAGEPGGGPTGRRRR